MLNVWMEIENSGIWKDDGVQPYYIQPSNIMTSDLNWYVKQEHILYLWSIDSYFTHK
jgi:hypothetical protein